MRLPNWLRFTPRITQKQVWEAIADHEVIIEKADKAIDKLIAALDGENDWFECKCLEIKPKLKEKKNGVLPHTQHHHCGT